LVLICGWWLIVINSYIIMMNFVRKYGRNKLFWEGGVLKQEDFRLPFKMDPNRLTTMFELRKWFILNTPHKRYAEKVTNEMTNLHNEINYQQSQTMIRRGAISFALIYLVLILSPEDAIDWKDNFDIKHNQKVYGSLTSAAGEGGSSIDE
jgi:hypothetical protein